MKDTKHTAVVLAADDKSAFALAATIISLKENSPKLFDASDIYVYTQDMGEQNRQALLNLASVTFKQFKLPFDSTSIKTITRYSELTMARYECFNLLTNYKNVLWLDTDIIVKKELLPILAANSSGWAWVHDDNILASNFYNTPIALDKKTNNFNAGVLFLSQKLPNYNILAAWCYEYTKIMAPELLWIDQAVLNAAIQKLNIQITVLPREYNANPFSAPVRISQAYILHAMGEHKFWNDFPLPEWFTYYQQWLQAGGDKMPQQKINATTLFCFKIKLLIEKIPFIWGIFKIINKIRFNRHNKHVLINQEK